MTIRRLLVTLLLAVAGYGALAVLFPQWNPAARWGLTLDRHSVVDRARHFAAERGLDVAGWTVDVDSTRYEDHERARRLRPELEDATFFSPIGLQVVFHRGRGDDQESFRVRFEADGEVSAYLHRVPGGGDGERPTEEEAREWAERALREITGPEAAEYRLGSSRERGDDGLFFVWARTPPEMPEATVRLEMLTRANGDEEVRARVRFDERFRESRLRPGRRAQSTLAQVKGTVIGLAFLAALIVYVALLVRGEPLRRPLLVAGLVAYVLIAVFSVAEVVYGIPGSFFGTIDSFPLQVVNQALGSLFIVVLTVFPILGAGRAAARRASPGAIASLELLLTGRLLTRPPPAALASGLLLGGAAAAVPYLVAASGLFPGTWISGHGASLVSYPRLLMLLRVDVIVFMILLAFFGFVAPLFEARLRSLWLRRTLFLIVLTLALAQTQIEGPVTAALVEGALLAIFYERVYRTFDFLTVLFTAAAGSTAANALSLYAQPSVALRGAGVFLLSVLGVLLVAALVVAFRGREATVDFAHETRGPGRTERERVRAEMQIARRAQLEMLPPSSPELERYAISAACEPAREVGGDLYDFVELPEGCLGIAVGDVSGKGMGAAYYMALTKGLLLGAAEDRLDPGETLAEVNRALYELKANRVFVTMFYGVLNPAAGTLTYARAGHNPIFWRRVARGETLTPCPTGLALGMNGGGLFERTLTTKEITVEPGDGLFFYSDGITEAMNRRDEEYGDDRLLAAVARTDGLDAQAARDLILDDVAAFVGDAPSHDDVTLVVIRAL